MPTAIAAGQRDHILETHLLKIRRSQRGTAAAATVQHQLAILVGGDLIDIDFQNAARQMDCSRDCALRLLLTLADIDKEEIVALLLHVAQIVGIDLGYLRLGLVDQLLELRQRHACASTRRQEF